MRCFHGRHKSLANSLRLADISTFQLYNNESDPVRQPSSTTLEVNDIDCVAVYDRPNKSTPPAARRVWSDDRWVGDDRDASCSSSSSRLSVPWLVSVTGMMREITAVLRQPTPSVPLMASYRGQFTRGKTCPRRGDGERQGGGLTR